MKKKRKILQYVSNQEIKDASLNIYGYETSPKRGKKSYTPNKIEKETINKFN